MTLAAVVREICARSGVTNIDTSGLHGFVRGYVASDVGDARRDLQPLMLAYGFDAIERGGSLVFRNRKDQVAQPIALDDLALHNDLTGDVVERRDGQAEAAGRVRLAFAEADGDHRTQLEEAVMPDETTHAVAESEIPVALTRAEARQTVERWLTEARVARDTVRLSLPLSKMDIGAGDVVTLDVNGAATRLRIDRIEQTTHQLVDAVRVEDAVYAPSAFPDDRVPMLPVPQTLPVLPLFMDLPLMTGNEVPHAPHVAAVAEPWPGSAAVYGAAQDAGYQLELSLPIGARFGVTETDLFSGPAGRFQNGAGVNMRLTTGNLQTVTEAELLAGANLFAIGDGTPDAWELFQARDAVLQPDGSWRLDHLLRGQFGTDGLMPDVWPAGSYVVAMDSVPVQLPLTAAQRGVQRHYRIGPGRLSYDSPLFVHQAHSFAGNGLRPYRPAHLTVQGNGSDILVTWVRRTRLDGDGWESMDVPLGEESESYQVEIRQAGQVVRQQTVNAPSWSYSASDQTADGLVGMFDIRVAQISARYGPGPFAQVTVNG